MAKKYNLNYYVYVENFNKRKLEKYNVLNDSIVDEIVKKTKAQGAVSTKDFSEIVRQVIGYYYRSRSEWEIVITTWPPHITNEELARQNKEYSTYQERFGALPSKNTVNLDIAEKLDIYDQVMLNWNIFISYLWENLKGKVIK